MTYQTSVTVQQWEKYSVCAEEAFLCFYCTLAQIPTSVFSSFNEIFTLELTVTSDIFRLFESKL